VLSNHIIFILVSLELVQLYNAFAETCKRLNQTKQFDSVYYFTHPIIFDGFRENKCMAVSLQCYFF